MFPLSVNELVFISTQMGLNQIIGINNVYAGWLAEEIAEALSVARNDLAEKEIISVIGENIIIDSDIENAFEIFNFSEKIVLIKSEDFEDQPSVSSEVYIYLNGEKAVFLFTPKFDDTVYFVQHSDRKDVLVELSQILALGSLSPEQYEIELDTKVLSRLQDYCITESEESATNYAAKMHIQDGLAQRLIECFTKGAMGSLVVINRATDQLVYEDKVAWIRNQERGWEIQTSDKDNILRLIPKSSKEIFDRIMEIFL